MKNRKEKVAIYVGPDPFQPSETAISPDFAAALADKDHEVTVVALESLPDGDLARLKENPNVKRIVRVRNERTYRRWFAFNAWRFGAVVKPAKN